LCNGSSHSLACACDQRYFLIESHCLLLFDE